MWAVLYLFATCSSVLEVYARGPICLHGTNLTSPEASTDVTECWPWESCFAEHHVTTAGQHYFNFGCRATQQCEANKDEIRRKRFDLKVCDECCTSDVCNMGICANNTAPDSLPCLHCSGVPTISSCKKLNYCNHGEVCFTEKLVNEPNPTFNLGCLRKDVCSFFEGELVGRRSADSDATSICHECCETPGCNRDSCSQHEESTAISMTTAGSMTTNLHLTTTMSPQSTSSISARDCWDLLTIYNISMDGIYTVVSPDGHDTQLRCDMTTDGGGWVVLQKRFKGSVNFNRDYSTYRQGFGTMSDEFWMGNDLLHEFTKDRQQRLRVDICSWTGTHKYAVYDFFMVGPTSDEYRLSVASYSGDAGDALITGSGGNQFHNNQRFSTPETDRDNSPHRNCARDFSSGWWFGDCFSANPNGVYHFQGNTDGGGGLQWRPWFEHYSFKGMEMKLRPSHVPSTNPTFSCPVH